MNTESFLKFVDAYETCLASLTGIAEDTISCDDDPEASKEFWEHMLGHFLNGKVPVVLANEDALHFVP